MKLRLVRGLQRFAVNPAIRQLFRLGIVPPGMALLETTGRRTGQPRRVPVGDGRVGDEFWIVVEHGHRAAYVRNLVADPRVRVQSREGLRLRWRSGTAHVLEDDDPRERQRIIARGHPMRRANAAAVRVMGVDLLTVRIDLDPR